MKYLHPVSIYWNWIASKKKMCSKMSSFCLVKKRPPPPPPCKWEWIGAIRRPLRKTDKIFNERKDDILLSCKQILNCLFAFWNICLTKLQFSRRIIIVPPPPKNAIFGPNVSPWCPVQVFVRSQQMPHWVVSSEVLTTYKVYEGRFCLTISNLQFFPSPSPENV